MVSYFDYMASTPLDPAVQASMIECLQSAETYGNPSAQSHRFGWLAAELIETARAQVADLIHADPREIVWTAGATEANNLALKGAALFYQRKGKHIITMRTEHASVLNTCAYLENLGFSVTYLKPAANGLLNLDELQAAMRPDTVLVSIMWVNNETGVKQDIAKISQLTRRQGIIFHVDAVQAAGKLPIDLQNLPVDLMTFSAHKLYGPKGIGALYVRRTPRIRLQPQMLGGEQEHGLRSGTLPTHQIVGMGKAFQVAKARFVQDQQHIQQLSQRFWHHLQRLDGIQLNGDFTQRIPHCFNISVSYVEAEVLLVSLPQLALSSGAACHSAHTTPSHVLTAMGMNATAARQAVRISFGRMTTLAEIDLAVSQIMTQVQELRQLSPIWPV